MQLPPGLVWMLANVPPCEEPQAAQGTCPSTSEIGTTEVAAGAGPYPFWLGGRAYLTTGYGGAQYGLSITVPAVAGPINLGELVIRAAVTVAPGTGALTITSDPLPQSVDGVPLRIHTINLTVDRPEFVLNPTYCASRQITAAIEGAEGTSVALSNPFEIEGCQAPPTVPPAPPPTPAPLPPQPPKPTHKPSIAHVKEKLSGSHLLVTFTTSADGFVMITGHGVVEYRKRVRAGAHKVEIALNKNGLADRRHHRRLKLELNLKAVSGSVSVQAVFEL